jgi:hypothetical protein
MNDRDLFHADKHGDTLAGPGFGLDLDSQILE